MTNLRIIYDNAADRAALTASTTAGTLGVANLQNNRKGRPWRATGTTARLGATWAVPERIGGVFLPFCNLSPTASMRVRVSNESAATNLNTYSSDFWAPGYSRPGPTVVLPNTDVAPDGSLTMSTLRSTTAVTSYIQKVITGAPSTNYVVSVFIKAGSSTTSRLYIYNPAISVGIASVLVDWVSGVASLRAPAGWAEAPTLAPTPAPGVYRLSAVVNSGAGAGIAVLYYPDITFTALTSKIWGLSVTEGSAVSSYYPSLDTFTSRASIGTFFGSNGLLQTAAANVARMQYNPANLSAPPKLLLEPAATNLALQSGNIASANWNMRWGGAATVAADPAVLAPDGTPAYKVSPTSGGSGIGQGISLTAGVTYTFSMWVAAGTAPRSLGVWPASGSVLAFSTIPANSPMARYSVTYTAATTAVHYFGLQGIFVGDSLWCACGQVQVGLYADSYIPTTTAAVTRAADVAPSAPGVRPAGYIDAWQAYSYDSGMLPACPAAAAAVDGFTPLQAASAYSNGGGAYARHWLSAQMPALGLAIDIKDPANLQGYVEACRLVTGAYWSPTNNPDYGASVTPMDASTHTRTGAGDLWTDAGSRSRKMPLQLSTLPAADRTALFGIVRRNGMSGAMLVSLFPESVDLELERDHTIFGKLSSVSAMSIPYYENYSMPLEIEEL
ncbi:hypothetical protein CLU93_5403 [Janthinobacterium sp. 35]|uniref:phage head spike fiber domain-containing protein n=1 Tax=Janthinobacterium sp. 35 TaxID=2035210 RepID=UPI000C3F104F|nr:hypothetical protein [Janthinobacterium sp. 35]PIG31051.1 hypothetical protein CLU93_5403 [Janthinobacterium sp. 35]